MLAYFINRKTLILFSLSILYFSLFFCLTSFFSSYVHIHFVFGGLLLHILFLLYLLAIYFLRNFYLCIVVGLFPWIFGFARFFHILYLFSSLKYSPDLTSSIFYSSMFLEVGYCFTIVDFLNVGMEVSAALNLGLTEPEVFILLKSFSNFGVPITLHNWIVYLYVLHNLDNLSDAVLSQIF